MGKHKKVFKKDILDAAVQVLRKKGENGLNVRNIARELGISTQPLYVEFENFEVLKKELLSYAREKYKDLSNMYSSNAADKVYKAYGMAFLTFAKNEKELFKYLYLRERTENSREVDEINLASIIKTMTEEYGLSEREARTFHSLMALHCYGLGAMIATGYSSYTDEEISDFLDVEFHTLSSYLRLSKERRS